MKKRILVVEDDESLASVLCDKLTGEGFTVDSAGDGAAALLQARETKPDLVLLDMMVPSLDDFQVCGLPGARREQLPIVILMARTTRHDRMRALGRRTGDKILGPLALDELLARIRTAMSRSRREIRTLSLGEVVVDFRRRQASKKGVPLALTSRELALLHYLAEQAGRVVTRDEVLRAVWGYKHAPVTRTVDNFIVRLRRKIEVDTHHPRFIRTLHGDGYTLALTVEP